MRIDKRKQNRLHNQLDFFNAAKKRFISVYANKPHIRIRGEITPTPALVRSPLGDRGQSLNHAGLLGSLMGESSRQAGMLGINQAGLGALLSISAVGSFFKGLI